ncbi:unnamed protein product [Psylliodes chrysocephalus]|uniref:DNA primase large subunit C-terminal domain-containing protein n=1 Tax=Psylliodes chrysocephalus TaxID=3402493 RepID=A0A9P0G273_9CUCU|nr:unnamed protein product [Psylliodes chrysocephala]
MTFYMKPPRGILHLHKLEECVKERLLCYKNLKNSNTELTEVSNFQYLVEDSSLDRTGHFILRLLAYSSSSYQYDFIKNEINLLEVRLKSYDRQDMKQFLKRLLKHSREIFNMNENESLREIYLVFIRIFSTMLRNNYLKHIFKTEHTQGCETFTIKVHFHFCLSLVAKREVELIGGIVQIPCTMWLQFLLCLFETYLNTVLKTMRNSNYVNDALEDIRIMNILNSVRNGHFQKNQNISSNINSTLTLLNMFEESKLFPLCMMNLFNVLERTNRLAHNERFEFSLYLKGVGMSMSDSLKFWEHLYSKEHSTCSRCTHSWQKNEKRYIYGIRHLYGLEGSRRDYKSKNCSYLQEKTLGPREDGGCPFKKFDDDNLRNTLKCILPTKPDEIEIMIYERQENPNLACRIFLETVYNMKTNKILDHNVIFSNPVDYYKQLKGEIGSE